MKAITNLLARAYSASLYVYPRQFRLEYGAEMQRLFRDQCRDASRSRGMAGFILRSGADWFAGNIRERIDSARGFLANVRKAAPRGYAGEWAMTILLYLFATTTLVQAYVIPTGSMEGTLRVGDHMLVDRAVYARPGVLTGHVMPYREIQRGDIVAFLFPEDTKQTFVKRVIGLPGDHIRLVDKRVIRNGRSLTEPYTQHIDPSIEEYRDEFPAHPSALTMPHGLDMFENHVVNGEVVVPPGSLFVLGDNRDNSEDSRYWGFVPRGYVVGKPLFVYWSYDARTEELDHWNVAHLVDVAEHFFAKTRWERMFLVPKSQQAGEAAGQ
jgi:signal peptidase I